MTSIIIAAAAVAAAAAKPTKNPIRLQECTGDCNSFSVFVFIFAQCEWLVELIIQFSDASKLQCGFSFFSLVSKINELYYGRDCVCVCVFAREISARLGKYKSFEKSTVSLGESCENHI